MNWKDNSRKQKSPRDGVKLQAALLSLLQTSSHEWWQGLMVTLPET